jgi:hypothetical protein
MSFKQNPRRTAARPVPGPEEIGCAPRFAFLIARKWAFCYLDTG